MMLVTVTILCLLTDVYVDGTMVNKNVLFRPIKKISFSNSRWLLTIVHDINPYLHFVDTLSTDIMRTLLTVDEIITNYVTSGIHTIEYVLTFDKIKTEIAVLRDEMEDILNRIGDYRPLERQSNRLKRALLPFVGDALSWLFGTVSSSDLELIRGNINTLATNQQTLKHVVTESLSILNVSRLQISENRQQINSLAQVIRKLDLKLQSVVQDFQQQLLRLEDYVHLFSRIQIVLDNIKSMMLRAELIGNEIKLQINMLSFGHLTPSVIAPNKLKQLLLEIQDNLPHNLKLPKNPKKELWHYYKILNCASMIENNRIIVILNIPLLDNSDTYTIYKIHSLPVPMTTGNLLSKSEATFKFVATYDLESTAIAINYDKTKYSLLTADEAKTCADPAVKFCHFNSPLYPINLSPLCVVALFSKNKNKISNLCRVSVKPNGILPASEYIVNGFWTVVSRQPTRFSINCRNSQLKYNSILIKPPIQIIQLAPGCSASNDQMILPAHFVNETTYFDKTSFENLTKMFNESITDIWQPMTNAFSNYTLTKLPPNLVNIDQIPIEQLVSEIATLTHVKPDIENHWPLWKWVLLCFGCTFGVLIIYLLINKYLKPYFKKFFPMLRHDVSKNENISGKALTDLTYHDAASAPYDTTHQSIYPDIQSPDSEVPLRTLLNLTGTTQTTKK